jgi:hypothetical protein
MDSSRFDAIVRRFAVRRVSRRAALTTGGGGLAALIGAVAGRPAAHAQAQSRNCTHRGCRCRGGTRNACNSGLVCCPDNPGLPGGPGRCLPEGICNQQGCTSEGCSCSSGVQGACDAGLVCCADDPSLPGGPGRCETEAVCHQHQCQATTNPCPSSCAAGEFCHSCCSGYCGSDDHCGTPCTGVGCGCTAGVEGSCSAGLVCCQSQMNAPNAPGGPGMCATPDGCGDGGATAGEAQATPVA